MPIILIMLLFTSSAAAQATTNTYDIKAEYRHAALDYEETEQDFVRSKFLLQPDAGALLHVTWVTRPGTGENSFTGGIALTSPEENFHFFGGHFFPGFGSGLVAGRPRLYIDDPFRLPGGSTSRKMFTPCTSGNPQYALLGAAATFLPVASDNFCFMLSAFSSHNRRYISIYEQQAAQTGSSLKTVSNRITHTSHNREPVDLRIRGIDASCTFLRYFNVQAMAVNAGLNDYAGNAIHYDSSPDTTASLCNSAGGIYFGYADGTTKLFCEQSRSIITREDGTDTRNFARAGQGGIRIRHPFFSFDTVYRSVEPDYYSPLAVPFGGTTPGKISQLSAGLKPCTWLSAQVSASREKKETSYYRYHPGSAVERRNVQCRLNPWRPLVIQFRWRELQELINDGYHACRYDATTEYSAHGFRIRLKYSALDHSSGEVSHLYGGDARYCYTHFTITGAWYALLPGKETPLTGPLVTGYCYEPCQQAAIELKFDSTHCQAGMKVCATSSDNRAIYKGIEDGRIEGFIRAMW